MQFQKRQMIAVHFSGKSFSIMVIQVYVSIAEVEFECFYEDLQDLLELTIKKYVLSF